MSSDKSNIKISNPKLKALIKERNFTIRKIARLEELITSLKNQIISEKKIKNELVEIENAYRKKRLNNHLNLNKRYNDLKQALKNSNIIEIEGKITNLNQSITKAKDALSKTENNIRERERIIELKRENALIKSKTSVSPAKKTKNKKKLPETETIQETKPKPEFSPLFRPTNYQGEINFEADWDGISFGDGYITIKHKKFIFRKEISQSKRFFNEIKHYYNFHKVPKLIVKAVDGSVKSIQNQEILFYHLDFLNFAASNFGIIKIDPFKLSDWEKYTKQYYKNKLPFLFHTFTLKQLCEYCDPSLPIIPVGEVVINSSGSKAIHNSFLFPLKSRIGISLIWESIEESKASYVFSISNWSDRDIQTIFDYIAGETPYKRWSLIHSSSLKTKLKMQERIIHTDLNSWDDKIRLLR